LLGRRVRLPRRPDGLTERPLHELGEHGLLLVIGKAADRLQEELCRSRSVFLLRDTATISRDISGGKGRPPAKNRRVRRLAACAAVALPLLAAGCGNERVESGSLFDARAGKVSQALSYSEAGLRVSVPREFDVKASTAPQLFRASLDASFISSFAYRRKEQIPKTREELAAARRRLVDAAKKRDNTFRLKSSRVTRAAGAPAIELLGDQTIFRGRLRIRSLHVYKGNGEYVIELVAPLPAFARLERSTFPAIRRSLKVTGKVKAPKKEKKPAVRGSKKKKDSKKRD
jgi:hypothetical protein